MDYQVMGAYCTKDRTQSAQRAATKQYSRCQCSVGSPHHLNTVASPAAVILSPYQLTLQLVV